MSLRPRGTVEVKCSTPGCVWNVWVDPLDPRLPDGPFACPWHEPEVTDPCPCEGCKAKRGNA